ncbi:Cytochrome c [Planctomycetes bacterium Pan216]|uniref:Cytochrome c n=1 Tax=Kolteria novifilia TaxID=2527975 RepID=A0A518BA64_9BACT|nr:Cytochrome c [Planctomycetes bacterium Pan216]
MLDQALSFIVARGRPISIAAWCLCALLAGCGQPNRANQPLPPLDVMAFQPLFQENCAGCHGTTGQMGPAPPLNDALFLRVVTDQELNEVIKNGRPGTLMPGFGFNPGLTLSAKQVDVLVKGIRAEWPSSPREFSGTLPPYATDAKGDATRGAQAFALACARCHGAKGEGTDTAGAINDGAFLKLVSDQFLRRIVITGRPDLGMPDYRQQITEPEARALTDQEITDIVALLASWRTSDSFAQEPAPGATKP